MGFFVASNWLKSAATLPSEAYASPVIAVAFVAHLASNWKLAALAVLGVVAIACSRERLSVDWNDLEHGQGLRAVIAGAAFAVAWPVATAEYNFFADQAHLVDRILVVVLAVALVRKPLGTLPVLLTAAPMVFEFAAPISNYPWAFFGMPLHVLTLFCVWFVLGGLVRARRSAPFLFVATCLIAGHYWIPGLLKLQWGWIFDNELFYLLPATYSNGWLAGFDPETIGALASGMASLNFPMKVGALTLEGGCLFILAAKRGGLMFFLTGFIAFHIGVFSFTGIAMWQWIIVEALLLFCVWKGRLGLTPAFFTVSRRVAAIGFVAASPYWLESAALSWYDSPVNYVYRFESVGAAGQRHSLGPEFFAPFDKQFCFSSFPFLVERQALLPITWGATSKAVALELRQAETPEEVFDIEGRLGRILHEPERATKMHDFLARYAANYNRAPTRKDRLRILAAPPGIVTLPRADALPRNQRIGRIEATQVMAWFDGEVYHEIRRLPVLAVDVP